MTQTTAGAQRPRAQHFGSRVLKAPVVAHAGLLISWMVLWRFPVLMGDDRFFAITSELSRGRRTWEGIVKIIRDCWTIHNGHLADGLGSVLFGLGNTGIRLAMALFYTTLTFLLWAYVRLPGGPPAPPGSAVAPDQEPPGNGIPDGGGRRVLQFATLRVEPQDVLPVGRPARHWR